MRYEKQILAAELNVFHKIMKSRSCLFLAHVSLDTGLFNSGEYNPLRIFVSYSQNNFGGPWKYGVNVTVSKVKETEEKELMRLKLSSVTRSKFIHHYTSLKPDP
jgi:hypothetical protein